MKEYNLIQLDNGIRVLLHFQKSVITHSCIVVNAGSRDEKQGMFGIAHFIEHLVFKRTEKRSTNQILNRLEQVGGDLNAYTTKEYTCLHASFLNPYLERALDLFEDVLFHSTFPETEIEKERGVILDEIASYLDSPEESIMDDYEDLLFQGSGLGHNILGLEEDLKNINKAEIMRFMKETYNTSEIVIAISGDYTLTKVKRLAERIFAKISANVLPTRSEQVPVVTKVHQVVEKPINQAHYILGGQTFGFYDERKTALLLLNNMLGGYGMSSILNLGIREKYGIAYTIESNLSLYKDTGSVSIYLGTDEEKLEKAISLVHKELNKLKLAPISTYKLSRAKEKFKGQIALAEESRMSMIIAEAKNIIDYGRVISLEEVINNIDSIQATDLFELSHHFFDSDRLVSLQFKPE